MRYAAIVVGMLVCASALASDPGSPLDCGDWVFLIPGLSCQDVVPPDCTGTGPCVHEDTHIDLEHSDVDNDGNFLFLHKSDTGSCGAGTRTQRLEVWRWAGSTKSIIAYMDSRCVPSLGSMDRLSDFDHVYFDRTNGRLLVPLERFCQGVAGGFTCNYPDVSWVMGIYGFTTTFEVLQTYTPQPAQVSFRVPVMPEGFASADHFDTFYGPLAKPINFANAQPLACDYPATPPTLGDYLSVSDPLPDPALGTGRYYITAATYQNQTRYGRKTTAGVMTGRDPNLLPACVEP